MRIEIKNVCLKLKDNQILNNVSCELVSGNRYGLIGHNGAGKTMLLRAVCGFVKLDKGIVAVDGEVIGTKGHEFIKNTGAIVGEVEFYKNLTGFENLKLLADIKHKIDDNTIHEMMSQVGLAGKEHIKYKKYSTGMKARLKIAQAIMESPPLVILDEPFNGLDKEGVVSISKLINEYIQDDRILIITSHHEADINNLCNIVLEMDGGKIVNEKNI